VAKNKPIIIPKIKVMIKVNISFELVVRHGHLTVFLFYGLRINNYKLFISLSGPIVAGAPSKCSGKQRTRNSFRSYLAQLCPHHYWCSRWSYL